MVVVDGGKEIACVDGGKREEGITEGEGGKEGKARGFLT